MITVRQIGPVACYPIRSGTRLQVETPAQLYGRVGGGIVAAGMCRWNPARWPAGVNTFTAPAGALWGLSVSLDSVLPSIDDSMIPQTLFLGATIFTTATLAISTTGISATTTDPSH